MFSGPKPVEEAYTGPEMGPTIRWGLTILLMLVCAATPAHAQSAAASDRETQSPAASGSPDFLFGQPRARLTLGGAWLAPRARGDLFTFISDQLTLDRTDFRAAAFTGSVGIAVTGRVEATGDFEVSRHAIGSEYRRYVKADRSSITQKTQLNQGTVTFGARYLPMGRGQSISRFAFLPRRVAPFAGAGLSLVKYELLQSGEFVDFVDLSIFNHSFRSSGWSVGRYADAGADVQIWRMFFLNGSVRYVWANSDLSRDFVGFHGIDLSGFKSSTGVTIVF